MIINFSLLILYVLVNCKSTVHIAMCLRVLRDELVSYSAVLSLSFRLICLISMLINLPNLYVNEHN